MRAMKKSQAVGLGYSPDNRKRRRQHRLAAKKLLNEGGIFNNFSARGSSFHQVVLWHLEQARAI
jgi:hypothetical protein